jgi:CRISPR-associated protein Cmr2
MTAHILLITLGPVQEFIAQARRTRDLWYGSHLLSELGRAAARELINGGAQLIFPALERGDSELAPCPAPLRDNDRPPLNIPNKLLAEAPPGVEPAELARAAREAVMRFWREEIAAPVKVNCSGLLAPHTDAVWHEQVDTFVEFGASWAPLGDYARTRREVEHAIASRKNLRAFAPWTSQPGNVPKSSLDGARDTVLRPPREREPRLARKYRIADGEQLDAVGLVKRAGGEPGQFVPVVNVALASWVARAREVAASQLGALRDACEASAVSRVSRDIPCARPFPFDASVLLRSRWKSVFDEQGLQGDPDSWGRGHVAPLLEVLSEPYPYVACLVGDGDRMGQAIDRLGSADAHRAFSRALSGFARQAREIVEQRHRGALVYAGGDDVLAFLPLPEAIACADELRRAFLADRPESDRPTLSVGIGIGHLMESMGDLLALGREAEREAKRDRNALAVIVDKRSGGRRSWRARWEEDPAGRLREDAALLTERLSSRKVYEVAHTVTRLPEPTASDDATWARLLSRGVRRSLARAGEGGLTAEDVGLSLDESAGYGALHDRVRAWVSRMLIARTFAEANLGPRRIGEEVTA